jgi:very-short-patch-repair endonuclease
MDGKRASWDRALSVIAERQHGVVSIGQLRAIGISEDAAAGRVRAGRLHRIHRGAYSVGHRALSDESRWMAAVLACGKGSGVTAEVPGPADQEMSILDYWGATISHRSAAELWQLLPTREGPVDVSVHGDGGRRKRVGIRLHRSRLLRPSSVTLRRGIPVTTPAKTITDLERVSTGRRSLIAAWELRRATRQANVLGLPLEERNRRRERSDLEEDFLMLCRRYGLPTPEVNVRVGGELVDFLWREQMVVVETDGYIYHRGRGAFEDDRRRDLSLRALGYDVARFADSQIEGEPDRIAAVLRHRLARFPSSGPETRQSAP